MQSPPRPPTDDLLAQLAPATDAFETVAREVGALEALDTVARPVQEAVKARLGNELVRDALTGRWLGHSVHPVLTDLPIGFWTSAFTLDLIGGKRSRTAAQRLVGIGVLCALPTAAAGAADWSDTTGPERRVGLVHAGAQHRRARCFACLVVRAPARVGTRAACSTGSSAARVATGGGFFGGHLVQRMGLAVDHTVFEEVPDEWTATDPVSAWRDDAPRRVDRRVAPTSSSSATGASGTGSTPTARTRAGRSTRARSRTAASSARGTAAGSGSTTAR